MMTADLNQSIQLWMDALGKYSFEQLCTKPSPTSWSLGQLYLHLIADTQFYLEQIKICVSNNEHVNEEAAPFAKQLFADNEFPDTLIEGAPSNALIPQPASKEQLVAELLKINEQINYFAQLISTNHYKGKAQHPGLGYFNAAEWIQFADIHFRHHLRQQKRIDAFLNLH